VPAPPPGADAPAALLVGRALGAEGTGGASAEEPGGASAEEPGGASAEEPGGASAGGAEGSCAGSSSVRGGAPPRSGGATVSPPARSSDGIALPDTSGAAEDVSGDLSEMSIPTTISDSAAATIASVAAVRLRLGSPPCGARS
jgi:hypothetical protein